MAEPRWASVGCGLVLGSSVIAALPQLRLGRRAGVSDWTWYLSGSYPGVESGRRCSSASR